MSAGALLQVEGLCVGARAGQQLLHDIAFAVRAGETFALLGESGSGKSLTALSVLRLLPDALRALGGRVLFEGEDLLAVPERRMRGVRGRRIGAVFQEPATALNPVLTIGAQLREVLRLHHGLAGRRARAAGEAWLARVELDDPARVFDAYAHELSGGMKQRAMIALALAGEPALLIADEPTTALDVTIQAQIIELLKSLQARLGMGMLFISHNLAVVASVADRIAVMKDGRLIDEGAGRGFFAARRHPYSARLRDAIAALDAPPPPPADGGGGALLELRGLAVDYPTRAGLLRRGAARAVADVSLRLGRGRTLALVGESGSGKTTVARAVARLVEPAAGEILFDGRPLGDYARANGRDFTRRVQMVFQDPFSALNPKLPVGESIAEGLFAQGAARADALAQVAEAMTVVGLDPATAARYPNAFSGGQRQRICLARALVLRPDLLICDEPTSALDVVAQERVLELLRRLQGSLGLSCLFISHDVSVVGHMAHDIAVMRAGRVVEQGPARRVLDAPSHAYTRALLAAAPTLREAA